MQRRVTPEILKNGFGKCLVPWNPKQVCGEEKNKQTEIKIARYKRKPEELQSGLKFLEKRIGPYTSLAFKKRVSDIWEGDLTDLSLFKLVKTSQHTLRHYRRKLQRLKKK